MPGVAALQCARRLSNLRFGNLLLVRAACTVGFGMCGATSKTQTPQQAFDQVAEAKLRLFFQEGSGPNGGAGGRGCPTSHPGEKSITPALQWLTLNRTNVGGASAVCVLTARTPPSTVEPRQQVVQVRCKPVNRVRSPPSLQELKPSVS